MANQKIKISKSQKSARFGRTMTLQVQNFSFLRAEFFGQARLAPARPKRGQKLGYSSSSTTTTIITIITIMITITAMARDKRRGREGGERGSGKSRKGGAPS